MGVKGLVDVLKDVRTPVSLKEMSGLTMAVDLAVWICECNSVRTMYGHLEKLYLKNIFFRVSAAIKAGIKLIFVLDGKAPDLKLHTIAKRIANDGSPCKSSSGIRNRLNRMFDECCKLLDALGVPWIKAEGEAEALCAALNNCGLVDGVISNDTDCFLYGARRVYQNFSLSKKVDFYSMDAIEKDLHLNQRALIALGLLLGCDYYTGGVQGVGAIKAVKFLSTLKDLDPIDVLSSWRTKEGRNTARDGSHSRLRDRNEPSSSAHGRHSVEGARGQSSWEVRIRSRAQEDPNFPDEDLIQEYLRPKRYENQSDDVTDLSKDEHLRQRLKGGTVVLDTACYYLSENFEWDLADAFKKVLPLVTHLHLTTESTVQQVQLCDIIKKRSKDKVPCLDVRWTLTGRVSLDALPDVEMVTTEPEKNVKKSYPDVVARHYLTLEQVKKGEERCKVQKRQKVTENSGIKTRKITDFFSVKKRRHTRLQNDSDSKISLT